MNIDRLFSELESKLGKRGRSGYGDNDALAIVKALRRAVDAELGAAKQINSARETVLKNADDSARSIISEAIRRANEMVNNTDTVRLAEEKAEQILEATIAKQGELKTRFALYLDSKLCECENSLSAILQDIQNDRAKLNVGK